MASKKVDVAALHPLLTKRVDEFNIPPWPGEACFERVIVYCLPDSHAAREQTEGGIYIPTQRVDTDKKRSPRGIVVSAGLKALDILRSNGMDIGELVWFAPHVPFRYVVGRKDNEDIEFKFMNVGDIVLSEDILGRVCEGEIETHSYNNTHTYTKTENGITTTGLARKDPTEFPDGI
jgi:co-chaperonin GroES (HSP10)